MACRLTGPTCRWSMPSTTTLDSCAAATGMRFWRRHRNMLEMILVLLCCSSRRRRVGSRAVLISGRVRPRRRWCCIGGPGEFIWRTIQFSSCHRHVCLSPNRRHSLADVRYRADFVRSPPSSGRGKHPRRMSQVDPMYGPTVRCKGEFGDGQVVLRQYIRPRRGASSLRAMMGISAHSFSLADRPVAAFRVTRSRMRQQTVAPSLGSLSQTSVGSSSCSSST